MSTPMTTSPRDWEAGRSAQVKEEPAKRAGDTEQNALPSSLPPPTTWQIGGRTLTSRFLLGTAGYPSPAILQQAIAASGTQVVTVGLRRQLAAGAHASADGDFFGIIKATGAHLLPNTAGCHTAREAITQLVKDGFEVFPYCMDDLVSCQRLLDAGCNILMPWGAPIGSG